MDFCSHDNPRAMLRGAGRWPDFGERRSPPAADLRRDSLTGWLALSWELYTLSEAEFRDFVAKAPRSSDDKVKLLTELVNDPAHVAVLLEAGCPPAPGEFPLERESLRLLLRAGYRPPAFHVAHLAVSLVLEKERLVPCGDDGGRLGHVLAAPFFDAEYARLCIEAIGAERRPEAEVAGLLGRLRGAAGWAGPRAAWVGAVVRSAFRIGPIAA